MLQINLLSRQISRAEFLRQLAGAAVAGGLLAFGAPPPQRRLIASADTRLIINGVDIAEHARRYGLMTLDRYHQLRSQGLPLTVLIDGEDVTNRCTQADDLTGIVHLHKHRNGHAYLEDDHLAMEIRVGEVRFVPSWM